MQFAPTACTAELNLIHHQQSKYLSTLRLPNIPQHAITKATFNPIWNCNIHGELPLNQFNKHDLARNCHRCKRCLADKMMSYRRRKPLQHMWYCFMRSARLHFGNDAVDGLRWTNQGQALVEQLVAAAVSKCDVAAASSQPQLSLQLIIQQHFKLTWGSCGGTQNECKLDLKQVHLVRKRTSKLHPSPALRLACS